MHLRCQFFLSGCMDMDPVVTPKTIMPEIMPRFMKSLSFIDLGNHHNWAEISARNGDRMSDPKQGCSNDSC